MFWQHARGVIALDRPRLMGILNVTPDSFSDGGAFATLDTARRQAECMLSEGADIIDVGGESTRPGTTPVPADEELRRVIPVIEAILRDRPETVVSIDTVKATVASAALAAGASIVNDVSGLRLDAGMAEVCAKSGSGVVLMHSRGDVADMATFAHADYDGDVVEAVKGELSARLAAATAAGVERSRIALDPGIGFAKRGTDSVAVLAHLGALADLGQPIVVGVSRKRFIGALTGAERPADRVAGSIGANVAALFAGARIFRVHDVKPARDALAVAWAIRDAGAQRA